MQPFISINIAVHNGEKYIRHCLNSIRKQSYPLSKIELNIWDNASTDKTKEIIKNGLGFRISDLRVEGSTAQPFSERAGRSGIAVGFAKFSLIESRENLGMWPAHEKLLEISKGEYIAVISADIILHQDFIKNSVDLLQNDEKTGAIEPKILRFYLENGEPVFTEIIDTLGFKIFRSREINNIGHGENIDEFLKKNPEFGTKKEIFAVEGACPVFRKTALEDCKITNEIIDPNMFWYGDDLDISWRMRIFGWKHIYSPKVAAWHDRQTTKNITKNKWEFIKMRGLIPMNKRRLGWRNERLSFIKNDFAKNFLKDLPFILTRETMLLGYMIFFEFPVLLEIPKLLWLLPQTLKKRREIMKKSRITAKEFRKWIE